MTPYLPRAEAPKAQDLEDPKIVSPCSAHGMPEPRRTTGLADDLGLGLDLQSVCLFRSVYLGHGGKGRHFKTPPPPPLAYIGRRLVHPIALAPTSSTVTTAKGASRASLSASVQITNPSLPYSAPLLCQLPYSHLPQSQASPHQSIDRPNRRQERLQSPPLDAKLQLHWHWHWH